jgi:hypothetical protein|tara:strand:- start:3314 stop:3634 length:321 start_codon:yes stop_codon:yes gene_type:complete
MAKKKVKKAQKGTEVTADSTAYLKKDIKMHSDLAMVHAKYGNGKAAKEAMQQSNKAREDLARQWKKGKRGFNANGFPIKKKTGGAVKRKTSTTVKRKIGGPVKKKR